MDAQPPGKRRIALLDDHPIVLLGVSAALSQQYDFMVVGTYADTHALMLGLTANPADVLVIDYSLDRADLDGASLIRMLTTRFPSTRLLVYSSHYDAASVASALRSGVRGYVGKSQDTSQLALAIRAVANGDIYLEAQMSLQLVETTTEVGRKARAEPVSEGEGYRLAQGATLSTREREVIRCFLNGLTVSEIAQKFGRSVKTISTQKSTAYRKLGVSSDNGLFKIAQLLGDL